jgi:hypothetical protein
MIEEGEAGAEEVGEMTGANPWRSTGVEPANWRNHAAWSGLDLDLFFSVSTSGASLGIWGGTTEEERRARSLAEPLAAS